MTNSATTDNKPQKPWYMKWWVWLIAAAVLIGVIGNLAGGTDSDEPIVEEQVKVEEPATEDVDLEPTEAEMATSDAERSEAFEDAIKTAFGGVEFSTLLAEDPTMWAGWISEVRVEGSNAFVRLQLTKEDKDDDIGKRAAKALSTLLTKEDVDGIDWIIVEDASGTVMAQQQPAPLL